MVSRSAVVAVLSVKMRSTSCLRADTLVFAHSGRHILTCLVVSSSPSPSAGTLYAESSGAVSDYFVYKFMNQCNNRVYPFIPELMDFSILFLQCLAVNRSD